MKTENKENEFTSEYQFKHTYESDVMSKCLRVKEVCPRGCLPFSPNCKFNIENGNCTIFLMR